MSVNTFIGMGRITADPELRTTANGIEFTTFSIAIDRFASKEKVTDFIPCMAWRKTAAFVCKWFAKGDMIAVTGSLQSRKWSDNDGKAHTAYEVMAENVSFCGGKKDGANPSDGQADLQTAESPLSDPAHQSGNFETLSNGDDLPF